jgi:DNA-binding MltR family transcriptional regulator
MTDLETLFNDREGLIDVLNKESPIGCILVSVSFLEKCLLLLLKDKFIKNSTTVDELLKYNGILGEFSSKAKLCYSLSLINKGKYSDLIVIAEIRNLIAHSHTLLDFSNPQIIEKCNELKICEKSLTREYLALINDDVALTARSKFTEAVFNIINELMAQGYIKKILNNK